MSTSKMFRTFISGFAFGSALAYAKLSTILSQTSASITSDANTAAPQRGGDIHDVSVIQVIIILSLTTLATSMLVIHLYNDVLGLVRLAPRKPSEYSWFPFDGNVVGGFVQGVGMCLIRSDPGLMFLNLGRASQNRFRGVDENNNNDTGYFSDSDEELRWWLWTVFGGVLGGFAFVLGGDTLKRRKKVGLMQGKSKNELSEVRMSDENTSRRQVHTNKNDGEKKDRGTVVATTLHEQFGMSKHAFVPLVIISTALIVIANLLYYKNNNDKNGPGNFTKQNQHDETKLQQAIYGGIAIGLSQLLSLILTKSTLGVSSFYPALATHVIRVLAPKRYASKPNPGYSSYVFTLGLIVSGFVSKIVPSGSSSSSSRGGGGVITQEGMTSMTEHGLDENTNTTTTTAFLVAILGGFSTIVGARLAGGCTSGHGISGCGLLSMSSFVTVLSIVIGVVVACHLILQSTS